MGIILDFYQLGGEIYFKSDSDLSKNERGEGNVPPVPTALHVGTLRQQLRCTINSNVNQNCYISLKKKSISVILVEFIFKFLGPSKESLLAKTKKISCLLTPTFSMRGPNCLYEIRNNPGIWFAMVVI